MAVGILEVMATLLIHHACSSLLRNPAWVRKPRVGASLLNVGARLVTVSICVVVGHPHIKDVTIRRFV